MGEVFVQAVMDCRMQRYLLGKPMIPAVECSLQTLSHIGCLKGEDLVFRRNVGTPLSDLHQPTRDGSKKAIYHIVDRLIPTLSFVFP